MIIRRAKGLLLGMQELVMLKVSSNINHIIFVALNID